MIEVPPNWFENFFHGVTLDLWREAISPEQTHAEAEFLATHLNRNAGDHILDVPCGNGRLSFELARRGFRVTGVDISEEFIEEGRSRLGRSADAGGTDKTAARSHPDYARTEFVLRDMRNLEGVAIYDGAYCFGNSFAFFQHADMEKFLAGVARALKSGARFIVETGMAAESVLPDFEEQSSYEVGDLMLTLKERYVAAESCIDSEYIFERNGATEKRFAREWIYTTAEIRRMLKHAGFEVVQLYGSLKCEPYVLGSQELFVVSEKAQAI